MIGTITVREYGSIQGVPVAIEDKLSDVVLQDRNQIYSNIKMRRDLVKEIAEHLHSNTVRLHGLGIWRRDQCGGWQLKHFKADSFEVLDDAPLSEVLQNIRALPLL